MLTVDFLTVDNLYNSTAYFTQGLRRAFEDYGAKTRLFSMDAFRSYCDASDMTLSFSYIGFETEEEDLFIGDYTQKPHFTYWVDGAVFALPLFRSPYNYVSVVDHLDYQGFKTIGKDHILFLPHAVAEEDIAPMQKKSIDIAMTATFLDYKAREESWNAYFPKEICCAMKRACQSVLKDCMPIALALENALGGRRVDLPIQEIYFEVEYYCKGKDRMDLMHLLKGFNSVSYGEGFLQTLSFQDALKLFEKSKIIINSSPQFRHGSHERIFNGLAKGALVITNYNPYLFSLFGEGAGLLFYHPDRPQELIEKVHERLHNESLRQEEVERGRAIIQKDHTWNVRAAQIISTLFAPVL